MAALGLVAAGPASAGPRAGGDAPAAASDAARDLAHRAPGRPQPREAPLALAPGLPADDPRGPCLAAHADAPPRYRGLVRALCGEVHGLGIVGASVAVGEGGALRYVAAWGRTRAGGPPITPDTGFRVGSLTKVMTAALALALADDGALDLDAPLAGLLPELAEGVDDRLAAVTLRQLLVHAGGLADLWPADAPPAGDAWLRALGERELLAEPGALWSYANVGYALVGAALERAAGEPWADLLGRRILRPLGLRRTHAAPPDLSLGTGLSRGRGEGAGAAAPGRSPGDALSHGHLGRGEGALALDVAADFALGARGAAWTAPAGGVIASAPDLAVLALGLVDPARSPLSPAAIAALRTPALPTHERPGEGQAPGLRVTPLPGGGALLEASGDTGDFAADLYLAPDRGLVLVLLGNTGDHLRATAAAGLHELLGVGPRAPGPAADLRRYEGAYGLGDHDLVLEVRAASGRLTLAASALGPEPVPLEHLGDHRFRAAGRPDLAPFTFVFTAPDRPATHLRARGLVATRRP